LAPLVGGRVRAGLGAPWIASADARQAAPAPGSGVDRLSGLCGDPAGREPIGAQSPRAWAGVPGSPGGADLLPGGTTEPALVGAVRRGAAGAPEPDRTVRRSG